MYNFIYRCASTCYSNVISLCIMCTAARVTRNEYQHRVRDSLHSSCCKNSCLISLYVMCTAARVTAGYHHRVRDSLHSSCCKNSCLISLYVMCTAARVTAGYHQPTGPGQSWESQEHRVAVSGYAYIFHELCVDVCAVPAQTHTHSHTHAHMSLHETGALLEVDGWGRVPFSRNFMKPTPRRKWYLTTGRRFH